MSTTAGTDTPDVLGQFLETIARDGVNLASPGSVSLRPTLPVVLPPAGSTQTENNTPGPDLSHLPLVELSHGGDPSDLEVRRILGQGGMGQVVLAYQRSLEREVAVKTLRPDRRAPAASHALLGEAVLTGTLDHPNIIAVHTLGRDRDGGPVLVMKRVEGVSWAELLAQSQRARASTQGAAGDDELGRHLGILMQVCNAVHFAHTRGIVHRDLKPDNVMVGDFGEVYVLDWGVAVRLDRLSELDGVAGTPSYMAPEMLRGPASLSPQTDVYLLGAVLHELLTGAPPHQGSTLGEVLQSVLAARPPGYGPDVPSDLGAVARRAMEADPAERFPSVLGFQQALRDVLRHRGSTELVLAARQRLAEAQAVHSGSIRPEGYRLRLLLAECRFGVEQALHSWPGNPEARAVLDECLALQIEHEIRDRNRGAAADLLDMLSQPRPDLREQLARLDEQLAHEAAARSRLLQLEREQDVRIASPQRTLLGLAMLSVNLIVSAYLGYQHHRRQLTVNYRLIAEMTMVMLCIVASAAFLGRRSLFKTRISRQMMYSIFWAITSSAVNRWLSLVLKTPPEYALIYDILVFGVVCGAASFMLARWLFAIALAFWGVALALAYWGPDSSAEVLGLVVSLALGVPVILWNLTLARSRPGEQGRESDRR